MRVSIIAAVSENGVIGRNNELPWHLPADFKRFKQLTMGHHLLVGRKTFEAIGRPLAGRRMVVISRGRPALPEGVELARSFDHAVEIARTRGETEAFVGGGAEIYQLALPQAGRLYLTRIQVMIEGDARFPSLTDSDWVVRQREDHEADEANRFSYSFLLLERVE